MSAEQRLLVAAALRWAREQGWRGFGHRPRFYASPGPNPTYVYRSDTHLIIARPGDEALKIRDAGQALNVMAAIGLLPARFSTLGSDALRDHAEVCRRFAVHLMGHDGSAHPLRGVYAAGLHRAGTSAMRMAESGTW